MMDTMVPTDRWDTDHMPDLTGKVVIVTGGNTGIGLQAANAFAGKGAETILACRNKTKSLQAVAWIKKRVPEARVRYMHLDLGSMASVRRFAELFKSDYSRLDILLNNAGVILVPYKATDDGFESQVGINHLGHFALTGHLIDLLEKTDGARVINISSKAHRKGRIDFDNFQYPSGKGFSRIGAYSRSKLANLLFTCELEVRFRNAHINAMAVAAHPGYSYTDFGRATFFKVLRYIFYPLVVTITQSSARGALPSLRAAVDPEAKGGDYYGPGGRGERKGYPVKVRSNDASHNANDARLLWEISEELTGVRYL
jgi:NAD(P)-dependent dehydrogenase (short-subunit alcohol dehydrogenase family)